MNMWIIVGIIAGLLLFAGIAVVKAISLQNQEAEHFECPYANSGNSCTPENNCGVSTCAAAYGGSCGYQG